MLMHREVAEAVGTCEETSLRPPRQPQQITRRQVDVAVLGGQATVAREYLDQHVDLGTDVPIDTFARTQNDDVRVQIPRGCRQFPRDLDRSREPAPAGAATMLPTICGSWSVIASSVPMVTI